MSKTGKDRLVLISMGGDVWAWEKKVIGECAGINKRAAIFVKANGIDVEADRDGERFTAVVPLQEGKNRISAFCRQKGAKKLTSNEIVYNVRLQDKPKAIFRFSIDSEGIAMEATGSQPSEKSKSPIVKYIFKAREDNPAKVEIRNHKGKNKDECVLLRRPKIDGEYYFTLTVEDENGRKDSSTNYFVVEKGNARIPDYMTEHTDWVDKAIIYGVVPHNFGGYGKGFKAVTQKLDYLKNLGVNAIWLSPCTVTPTGQHGYAVGDYFNLRKDYGSKADFKKMVKEAHARGIRVMMDFVPNHSSVEHPYMQHAEKHGEASPYYEFYDLDKDDNYPTYYFYWVYLPNHNYDNPDVVRYMTEAFAYWVREFDVDGFRVDVAWGMRQRNPEYWPEWRRELMRIKPDLLLLAEASARDDYYFTEGYDAAYDWTDQLGHWAWENVFEVPNRIPLRLRKALTNDGKGYHEDAVVFRFLNNNDTGQRFITRYGLETTRVAAALLLTLPGVPCVYTGQEMGVEYEPYLTDDPITWKDEHNLRPYYKKLISLRKKLPCLHSQEWELPKVSSMQSVFAYVRYTKTGDTPALVVMNFSDHKAVFEVALTKQLAAKFPAFATAGELKDELSGKSIKAEKGYKKGSIRLSLPAFSTAILTPKKS